MDLVVGFDLDMTLVDPRPGVRVALQALGLDEFLAESLGPPLEQWLPAGTDLDLYRDTYLNTAHLTAALPGAAQALETVRSYGGRVLVVTAKRRDLATACLAGAGLAADELHASLWGETKGDALAAAGATVYVGDHPLDMTAARLAGAIGVGVATGPLIPSGADWMLHDLAEFPPLLAGLLSEGTY
jgi:phosphoglycolate phosphatase